MEMEGSNQKNWTVVGGGSGGHAVAGHLALLGHDVRLYDISQSTVEIINREKGIILDGEINGKGKIEYATTDLAKALDGADIIMVVVPATAHGSIARKCAPFLKDGQIVLLHPGSIFGAIEFKQVLNEENCKAKVILGESHSLIYACRSIKPGQCSVMGIKDRWWIGTIPSSKCNEVVDFLKVPYPQTKGVDNVLITSFENTNCIIHPVIMLLCIGFVESTSDWLFYTDGNTATISEFIEELDRERLQIAAALGIRNRILTLGQQFVMSYKSKGRGLREIIANTLSLSKIMGPKTLDHRYLTEDIPTGLIPLASLGKHLGVNVERMETVIKLSSILLKDDFSKSGRTVGKLGLSGFNAREIVEYCSKDLGTSEQNNLKMATAEP